MNIAEGCMANVGSIACDEVRVQNAQHRGHVFFIVTGSNSEHVLLNLYDLETDCHTQSWH